MLEIDTVGTFNMSKAAFNGAMTGGKGGIIINISASLHWNGMAMQAHSAAAKAGVDALTKVMATEWGPHNVRVVGIVPGMIAGTEGYARLTTMDNANNRKATESANEKKSSSDERKNILDIGPVPIMRFGEPEDIANCAIFLVSPAAAYMTGTNVVVDGGAYLTAPNMFFSSPEFVS